VVTVIMNGSAVYIPKAHRENAAWPFILSYFTQ